MKITVFGLVAGLLLTSFQAYPWGSPKPKKSYPKNGYSVKYVEGFTIKINRAFERDPLMSSVLKRLTIKLAEVKTLSPQHLGALAGRVTIWVTNAKTSDSMVYHSSTQWLEQNGLNPAFAKGVEISNMKNFLDWNVTGDQPMMVLHELAHAYHDQMLGFSNAQVKAVFDTAVANGSYEQVRYRNNSGPIMRAYALNNEREYFAEISEAWYGTNDYYPFIRSDLQTFDQPGHALLRSIYGP